MGCISYNDAAFRAFFPAYANTTTYPQATIQGYWNIAILYISNRQGGAYCGGMNTGRQTLAINQMTAHLLFLSGIIASGQVPAIMTGAGIDKINVSLEPPPQVNQWQYWLNTSPYGQQLLALLQLASVGGFYIPSGVPGRAGFQFGNGM